MRIREAARLVNKTERTIARWKLEGCKLDKESLLLWSEEKDFRARGRSKTRWREREDQAYVASQSSAPLAKLLESVPDGHFCALLCPASDKLQVAVCEALDAAG
jgi:hypothetical protein